MADVVVTGTFTITWPLEKFREEWGDTDATDEDILNECIFSVQENWETYATTPDTVSIQGEIVE